MQEEKEQERLEKAKRRQPDAFTELMQSYMKDMYRVALAILMNDEDVADAIQDTILACWEKIDTLKNNSYFKTWLTRILINKCYDIRKKRGNVVGIQQLEEPTAYDTYNLEFKEALASLDEKYRVIMILFYCEGYHTDEIGQILKIPKSTVQTRLQRGRGKLLAYYQEEYGKEISYYGK